MRVGNGVVEQIEVTETTDTDGSNTEVRIRLAGVLTYDQSIAGNTLSLRLHRDGAGKTNPEPEAVAASDADDSADEDAGSAEDAAASGVRVDGGPATGDLSSVSGAHGYAGGGNKIRGVDFQQQLESSVSRLVITGSGSLDYSTAYPSDNRVVVAIRDASLGTGLERKIDTSQFASAVSGISAFRSRQNKGEVKVVIDLRESVTPTVREEGMNLVLDFPIPPSIAGASYTSPVITQSAQDDGIVEDRDSEVIESAVAREVLIGTGGELSDPSTVNRRRQKNIFGGDGVFLGEIDPNHQWKGFPLNLNLVNADIHNVFRLISAVSNLNIVSSDDVDGEVTVQLAEVPWDQALAAILQAKGLGAVQYGTIVRVAPIDSIRKEREDAAAAKAAEIDSLPLRVLTLPLNYANANEVMAQLEAMLSKRGSLAFDERTNSLIVRDIDRNLSQIRQLVRALDTRTPQVHIEARIVEANSSFSRSLGIQWGGNLNFSPATGAPTGLFFPNSVGMSGGGTASTVTSAGAGGTGGQGTNFTTVPNYVVDLPAASQSGSIGLSLGSISNMVNLDARLTAGESNGTGKIISAPSITTVTNRPAVIRDGARIPYQTASLRGTNVQFVEAVLLLEVTPQITADGTIFLDVQVTKNRPDFGAAINNLPTIQIKEARTTVMVANGDTAVIGGVYSYEESINRQFVPGLGKIPVLGWLFKTTNKREARRELLVFITPTIVQQLK
jgi:type IV pilus assembly protein PilQ